ncbi:hypothetical protein HETIRDRAFT_453013 [Heterobasidion irregulare TC 32-1]|uniref:Uncharacterized protein n=1 Tax=Heterobasidion irregulare (strain TC 32-1) TaxID=747525 RepID=W4K3T8_HETIT|nr:uncharacterized protein HETIRDRAFT_453013 [Heterobasidion irregulare TC 32-1]ETW80005.1 hypothetical protein HETIRDRAFT_453013 [Heterobasidion irregulare TC 32-1]
MSSWHSVACIASTLEAPPFCAAIVDFPLRGRRVYPRLARLAARIRNRPRDPVRPNANMNAPGYVRRPRRHPPLARRSPPPPDTTFLPCAFARDVSGRVGLLWPSLNTVGRHHLHQSRPPRPPPPRASVPCFCPWRVHACMHVRVQLPPLPPPRIDAQRLCAAAAASVCCRRVHALPSASGLRAGSRAVEGLARLLVCERGGRTDGRARALGSRHDSCPGARARVELMGVQQDVAGRRSSVCGSTRDAGRRGANKLEDGGASQGSGPGRSVRPVDA